ncbi:putative STI1 domain containing protein, partial [Leishmania naiffi]
EIPAKYSEPSDADVDAAISAKGEAVELHADGKLAEAITKMSEALTHNPSNAMYWGIRALYHLEFNKPRAALHDANKTLELNSQNVRALRVRGTISRHLGHWEDSLKDLSAAQAIDYDEKTNETLKFVQLRVMQRHKRELARQHAEEAAVARRQEELRRQRQREAAEEAAATAEAQAASGGMPGGMAGGMPGGFPGGMPGGMPPGMESVLQDPDIIAAMQDPEVAPKLTQMMQNPMAAMSMMNDPKVGPVMQKIMAKMMGGGGMPGGMGGMGGMPGGMGGMPGGMGGMPGGMGGFPGASGMPPRGGAASGGTSRSTTKDDLD